MSDFNSDLYDSIIFSTIDLSLKALLSNTIILLNEFSSVVRVTIAVLISSIVISRDDLEDCEDVKGVKGIRDFFLICNWVQNFIDSATFCVNSVFLSSVNLTRSYSLSIAFLMVVPFTITNCLIID